MRRLILALCLVFTMMLPAYAENYIPVYTGDGMVVYGDMDTMLMNQDTLQMTVKGRIEFTPEGKMYEDYRTGLNGVDTERFTYHCDVLRKRGRFINVSFYDRAGKVLAVDKTGTDWVENDSLYVSIVEAANAYRQAVEERKKELGMS